MSGHSKWSTIKRKKAKMDAQRGKVFTKLIKEISIAAREGGGDPESNARLRNAISCAKAANMPAKNIESAIKKGTGELPGITYEENSYEGYGPGGVAVLVDVTTDNKNRTTAEIRHLFTRYGGNLGECGCVSWIFEKKGMIAVSHKKTDEDHLMEIVIESGAEDVKSVDEAYEIYMEAAEFEAVKIALGNSNIEYEEAEITRIPQNTVNLEGKQALSLLKLLDTLEEHDDVQNVYANFDIPEEVFQEV